jgi:hypothetical protein
MRSCTLLLHSLFHNNIYIFHQLPLSINNEINLAKSLPKIKQFQQCRHQADQNSLHHLLLLRLLWKISLYSSITTISSHGQSRTPGGRLRRAQVLLVFSDITIHSEPTMIRQLPPFQP